MTGCSSVFMRACHFQPSAEDAAEGAAGPGSAAVLWRAGKGAGWNLLWEGARRPGKNV